MERRNTPSDIETSVLVKSARRCTLCFYLSCDLSEKLGQIAHLDKDPSNAAEDNLAFLCLAHHTLYDSKTSQHKNYTIQEVKAAREKLYEAIANNKHAGTASPPPPVADTEVQRKLRAILPWRSKTIKLSQMSTGNAVFMLGPSRGSSFPQLLDCNEFFVVIGQTGNERWSRPIPLDNIKISHDAGRDCLELLEYPAG